MKNKKEHIDFLLDEAGKSGALKTGPDFMDKLNAKLDAENEATIPKAAPVTMLAVMRRYAAVFLLLILNAALMVFLNGTESGDQQANIEVYAEEYFPDYATLASLEE